MKVGKPALSKGAHSWTPAHADTAWQFATDITAGWAFNPDLILATRDQVNRASFSGLTAQMTPGAAKDWQRLFAKAKKAPDCADDGPTNALALWGYGPQPGGTDPVRGVTSTGSMTDLGQVRDAGQAGHQGHDLQQPRQRRPDHAHPLHQDAHPLPHRQREVLADGRLGRALDGRQDHPRRLTGPPWRCGFWAGPVCA